MVRDRRCYTTKRVSSSRLLTSRFVGAWLSLARAPGSGPGGRRFESSRPDHFSRFIWASNPGASDKVHERIRRRLLWPPGLRRARAM
jgi:hypothetical protein